MTTTTKAYKAVPVKEDDTVKDVESHDDLVEAIPTTEEKRKCTWMRCCVRVTVLSAVALLVLMVVGCHQGGEEEGGHHSFSFLRHPFGHHHKQKKPCNKHGMNEHHEDYHHHSGSHSGDGDGEWHHHHHSGSGDGEWHHHHHGHHRGSSSSDSGEYHHHHPHPPHHPHKGGRGFDGPPGPPFGGMMEGGPLRPFGGMMGGPHPGPYEQHHPGQHNDGGFQLPPRPPPMDGSPEDWFGFKEQAQEHQEEIEGGFHKLFDWVFGDSSSSEEESSSSDESSDEEPLPELYNEILYEPLLPVTTEQAYGVAPTPEDEAADVNVNMLVDTPPSFEQEEKEAMEIVEEKWDEVERLENP